MAKKKKAAPKKRRSKSKASNQDVGKIERQPEFMVNINDPKLIRKDILESLREIIIFMQGYEKFRAVQDEKTSLFSKLKSDVKEINTLIERKLRHHLPKGKLQAAKKMQKAQEQKRKQPVQQEAEEPEEMPTMPKKENMENARVIESKSLPSELDELESKLKDIESQLEGIQ